MFPVFYFGNIAYWRDLLSSDSAELSIGSSIPKKSYANRTIIATTNGLLSLSVPLRGGRGSKLAFRDIYISYEENWVHNHLMALQSAYSKSPYYEHYMDRYAAVLSEKPVSLFELNWRLFQISMKILRLQDLAIGLNETKLNQSDIREYIPNQFAEIPEYRQVFRNKYAFASDLSILDLIFNLGNKSSEYLKSEFP